jgi:tRNA(His) 5'-end guanylyltransferase
MKNLIEFDYLKDLEKSVETIVPSDQYLVARLDGNNFHTFTKGLRRPFDATLRETMTDVTKLLMKRFGASLAYQQSDEITLIWEPRLNRTGTAMVEHPRKGRVLKLSTLMSSYCTVEFYKLIHRYKSKSYNGFDCRMYGTDRQGAMDSLRFRFLDCAVNAYQSVAQSMWSQKRLNGVSVQEIKAMLAEQNINVWQEYGDDAMVGVYFYKEVDETTGRAKIIRGTGVDMIKMIKSLAQ